MKVAASLRHLFPLSTLCEYLDLPRSTFYYRVRCQGYDRHEAIRPLIHALFKESKGAYGYRRITYALKKEHGISLNRKTVAKIMAEEGLKARQRRKNSYSSYRGTIGKIADNHLKRDFKALRPYQKLVSDITQFNVDSKWIYLSPLIDLYNGEVISWRIGARPNMKLALGMLMDVYPALCKEKPVIHTDQGFQYQNPQWQILLKQAGCTQSMSRKGNCLDNAAAESFFGKVKTEFSDGSDFNDTQKFARSLDKWIHWYNERRIKDSLRGMSPVEYRKMKNPSALDFVQF